jgi:hypothetical protein
MPFVEERNERGGQIVKEHGSGLAAAEEEDAQVMACRDAAGVGDDGGTPASSDFGGGKPMGAGERAGARRH